MDGDDDEGVEDGLGEEINREVTLIPIGCGTLAEEGGRRRLTLSGGRWREGNHHL